MNTIHKTLLQFGLSEADVKVYLTLNRLGECDVPTLLDETKISRAAIYTSIDALNERKLLTHRKVGRTAYYNTAHPQTLEVLLMEKKQRDAELERTMEASIKELAKSYSLVSDLPGVYFFNGKEEVINMYEGFYQTGVPVDSIEENGIILKSIGEYAHTYVKKRIQHRMYNRCIAPDVNELNTTDPKKLREVRLVPTKLFPFRMDVKVAGNKTILATFSQHNVIGVMIDNKEIADNFHILFNFLWHTVEKAGIGDPRVQN